MQFKCKHLQHMFFGVNSVLTHLNVHNLKVSQKAFGHCRKNKYTPWATVKERLFHIFSPLRRVDEA